MRLLVLGLLIALVGLQVLPAGRATPCDGRLSRRQAR